MNEFVAENTDMSDVDFEVMSAGHGECFGQQQNCQFIWERYVIILARGVIICIRP